MTPLEVFLQLGTVFLGAFLAFLLENLRERRQLWGWANDYLRRVRATLATSESEASDGVLEATAASYDSFIMPDEGREPIEGDWNALMNVTIKMSADHRALLESPATRVLPAELVEALSELAERGRMEEAVSGLSLSAWQPYTVPLVLKQTQISDAERRGLEYTQGFLKLQLASAGGRREAEKRVLELLDQHNLGR